MNRLEVPRLADLDGLNVEVARLSEPWIVSVSATANDGARVTLIWDEIACSVSLQWEQNGVVLLSLGRETIVKISVTENAGAIEFRVWSDSDGLGGQLVVRLGERVDVSDSLLRK